LHRGKGGGAGGQEKGGQTDEGKKVPRNRERKKKHWKP
jgi:hypothetical protein